jgi:hypothetical protein
VYNASATNRYIAQVKINGVVATSPLVTLSALMPARTAACGASDRESTSHPHRSSSTGGLLEFVMIDTPMEWGTGRILTAAELAPFARTLPTWPRGVPQDPFPSASTAPTPPSRTYAHASILSSDLHQRDRVDVSRQQQAWAQAQRVARTHRRRLLATRQAQL